MKKICLNCSFCDVALRDKEYDSILDMIADDENNYLICLKYNKKTDDYFTCKEYKKDKNRENDLRG